MNTMGIANLTKVWDLGVLLASESLGFRTTANFEALRLAGMCGFLSRSFVGVPALKV